MRISVQLKFCSYCDDISETIETEDVYQEIMNQINVAASRGIRKTIIYFLDDDFKFKHIKPIVDRITKETKDAGVEIYAEGSSLIRPHLYIVY